MKIYGLIGKSLVHSFSRKFFSDFFSERNLPDYSYQNFELNDLNVEIPALKRIDALGGLNVTIPYKSTIIPFLDELTDTCREINACNCIEISKGKWIGHNTDVIGFERSFIPLLKPVHKKALVLGDGGAAGAVKFVLKKLQIPFLTVSRKMHSRADYINYQTVSAKLLSEYNIIINTTPVGMFPKVDDAPDILYELIGSSNYLYDLIYNPSKTLFLLKGEERDAIIKNGADMLEIQAMESWRIWNSISNKALWPAG